jgi:hypothetical protein
VTDEDAPSISLASLAIGSRLVVRSRTDWRFAAVSRISEGQITITVCSPRGRTYRLRRTVDAEIRMCGSVPVLIHSDTDEWRENFGRYDTRW